MSVQIVTLIAVLGSVGLFYGLQVLASWVGNFYIGFPIFVGAVAAISLIGSWVQKKYPNRAQEQE